VDSIYKHFLAGFREASPPRESNGRRIGAELKFPLVNDDGTAADLNAVHALWRHLQERGWKPVKDSASGEVVGARKPGEQNDTVASCETGYCKPEFSLAHVSNLFDLTEELRELREELRPFADRQRVHFLCYGIQPVTPPSERLMMKKTRTSVWDKVFGANRCVPEEDGDDVCLFTLNAATHVHVSVSRHEAIPAVNALNGFSGAQIALTANSNIWKGRIDPDYKCVSEKLWDMWMPDGNRVGVPEKPFKDLKDYVRTIAGFRPVYVKRDGVPIILKRYKSFASYYRTRPATGIDPEGQEVSVMPEGADIDLHSTCYWYNARLSRYYTVENRTNDQQPPDELLSVSALTLGLVSALGECREALQPYEWEDLRRAREVACCYGLAGKVGDRSSLIGLSARMLGLAEVGLRRRGLGEEQFLEPLRHRLAAMRCPADEAADLFAHGGIEYLVSARTL
jgi:gamma-glutamylcysteine synthetase